MCLSVCGNHSKCVLDALQFTHVETGQTPKGQRSKLGFYVPFNSQGHIGTGPQHCHL